MLDSKPITFEDRASITKKQYERMSKKHKKALKKAAKNFKPWEYSYFMDVLYEMLSYMKDYYIGGYNVWQSDESLIPLLQSLITAYNAIKDIQEFKFEAPVNEFYLAHPPKNLDDVTSNRYTEEQAAALKQSHIESSELKKEMYATLFNTIRDHIDEWWD